MRVHDLVRGLAARARHKPSAWSIVALAGLLAFLGAELSTHLWPGKHGDLRLYYLSAARFVYGSMPYRDFRFEYPPVALIAFAVPFIVGRRWFETAFALSNAVWIVGIGACVVLLTSTDKSGHWLWPKRPKLERPTFLFFLLAVACSPLVPWRYDLFPALLTAVALVCLLKGRPTAAGIFLGLGAGAKLYPIILGPVFVLYQLTRKQWGALLRTTLAGALVTVGPFAWIFLAANSRAAVAFLRYHSARNIQIESLCSGVVMLSRFGASDVKVTTGSGSWNLSFPGDRAAMTLQTWLLFAGLLVAYWACWRRMTKGEARGESAVATLAACSAGVVLTFIATNKVFSPQYIAWLLPFAPFLRLSQALGMLLLFVLTMLIYPISYDSLLALDLPAVLLLNARNALAVALILWIFLAPGKSLALGQPVGGDAGERAG